MTAPTKLSRKVKRKLTRLAKENFKKMVAKKNKILSTPEEIKI